MSSESDFERRITSRIETIVEKQAQFSEDMLKLDMRLDKLTEGLEAHSTHLRNLTDALLSLTNIVERQDEQIKQNSEQIKELTDNMNALIRVVERHISNHP